jgi:uncharacterized repeat protein (TIGR03809 family)
MTNRTDVTRGRDIVARWSVLAEQRLEYLTELFETGRWRRFHSEVAFLENIREAKAAVETWRDLLTREASLDNSAIDVSWLGRTGVIFPPRREMPRDQVRSFEPPPAKLSAESLARDISAVATTAPVAPDQVPSATDAPPLDDTAVPTLDLAVMQERYPLLRNAL